jgi:hypothetical protein
VPCKLGEDPRFKGKTYDSLHAGRSHKGLRPFRLEETHLPPPAITRSAAGRESLSLVVSAGRIVLVILLIPWKTLLKALLPLLLRRKILLLWLLLLLLLWRLLVVMLLPLEVGLSLQFLLLAVCRPFLLLLVREARVRPEQRPARLESVRQTGRC